MRTGLEAPPIIKGKGAEIFNSHYYEGNPAMLDTADPHKVTLSFWDINDYNTFLNWWVLGKDYRNKGPSSKSLKEDNPQEVKNMDGFVCPEDCIHHEKDWDEEPCVTKLGNDEDECLFYKVDGG